MQNLTGQTIDRYHIVVQIGEGGMAVVYKAYDTRLEREVAIKIIRKEAFPPEALDRIFKRFEREAKALARLSHPNIVKVHDYGEYEGSPYLVMEYHPGGTLKTMLGKPLDWKVVSKLLIPVASALGYAHQQGILHRDVKPSNILITNQGEPMLTDFGIAKMLDMNDGQTLTGTGLGVGTPEYMAPEQGLGKEVDARVDIYSLGVILYELVTGRKPYTADTPLAVLFKHMTDPLPRPSDLLPGLSKGIEKILIKTLAKDPINRYQDIESLVKEIESIETTQSNLSHLLFPQKEKMRPRRIEEITEPISKHHRDSKEGQISNSDPPTIDTMQVKFDSDKKGESLFDKTKIIKILALVFVLLFLLGIFIVKGWEYLQLSFSTTKTLSSNTLETTASIKVMRTQSLTQQNRTNLEITPKNPITQHTTIPENTSSPTLMEIPVLDTTKCTIAYTTALDGNWDIYVMSVPGNDAIRFTSERSDDFAQTWSPDGKKLAFSTGSGRDYEIILMDIETGNQNQLSYSAGYDAEPSWSPDGSMIAYVHSLDQNPEIQIINLSNSFIDELTDNDNIDSDPDWSPDSKRIAYESSRNNNDTDIYVMNFDGSNQMQLTDNDMDNIDPSWSPDGKKIAYVSQSENSSEIYVMNSDGKNQIRLSQSDSGDFNPSWSPDGKKILFVSSRDGNNEIYIMNSDGTDQNRITYTLADEWWPEFSPSCKEIL